MAHLYIDKITVKSSTFYVVKNWHGVLQKQDLPTRYLKYTPHYYEDGNAIRLITDSAIYKIRQGTSFTQTDFECTILPEFRQAGDRLKFEYLINSKEKKNTENLFFDI